MSWVDRVATDSRWMKGIAIGAVGVLVTAAASIGEVNSRNRADAPPAIADGPGTTTDGGTTTTGSTTSTSGGFATPSESSSDGSGDGTTAGTGGSTTGTSSGGSTSGGETSGGETSGGSTSGGSTSSTSGGSTSSTSGGSSGVYDYGLVTQGVTDEYVKFGITYSMSGCGDAGILEAQFGRAAGDLENALDAFTRYINDEQDGVNGREFQLHKADSGSKDCPEKAIASAKQLADDEKVFVVQPGLHTVADYFADRHLPTQVGRDDPLSLVRYGANGIGLTQEIGGVLEAWAAFGEHYLDSPNHKPCIVRPESGNSGDWDLYAEMFHPMLDAHNIVMVDELVYKDEVQTAQEQSQNGAQRLRDKGCDQVYFMAINPIAPVFFTSAATQAGWFPQWTFTSYMTGIDETQGGALQDPAQWRNAVGLSPRIPAGKHAMEGNCKRIYEKYHQDGNGDSLYTKAVCAVLLTSAEMMRRGENITGELTANSMLVGADTMSDYFYDANAPLLWRFPAGGPYTTKAWRYYTVVKWNGTRGDYDFPEFPSYWEYMGPNGSNGINMLEHVPTK